MLEVSMSKTYKKVIDHRRKCKKWGKKFCLDCFGGGLNIFVKDLINEDRVSDIYNEILSDIYNEIEKR